MLNSRLTLVWNFGFDPGISRTKVQALTTELRRLMFIAYIGLLANSTAAKVGFAVRLLKVMKILKLTILLKFIGFNFEYSTQKTHLVNVKFRALFCRWKIRISLSSLRCSDFYAHLSELWNESESLRWSKIFLFEIVNSPTNTKNE